ncbi:MAG TPA: filamentous hemagglutinin N-terminal domain-containing protein, partial [Steroidobacteraceae bacterium]|nr:filamentous hemagglutinin N-terminal domain-containing protein [Steroidobacteraceae bacterium]
MLNWRSFNISSDGKVTFQQPDASSVALNQIFQSDPSKILGALGANGTIYLINQNGILFGPGAKVNVGSLVASSLNLSAVAAQGGILQAGIQGQAAFVAAQDAQGNPVSGPIQVASGATLQTATGGQIMLFAPQLTNAGSIRADGGQVILAAGDTIYLAPSTDPNLRGLLVEVGHGGTVTNAAASAAGAGDAGVIASNEGNVTLTGLIVNQLGRVSATTTVRENGSIRLLAQDNGGIQAGATSGTLQPVTGGSLNLGAGSQTDVTLDLSDTGKAVDATPQPHSLVDLR